MRPTAADYAAIQEDVEARRSFISTSSREDTALGQIENTASPRDLAAEVTPRRLFDVI